MALEPVKNSVCPPESISSVRLGTVNNDMWAYWWCKNSTEVWPVWNNWLAEEFQAQIFNGAQAFTFNKGKAYLDFNVWEGNAFPVFPPPALTPRREALWQAAYAAIESDVNKPLPGAPNTQNNLPELWVVTPNGSNPLRKTSKAVNGVVQAYGSGTQTVKVGLPCDHTKTGYPLGSVTRYLPLYNNTPPGITDEVISCTRIQ